MTLAPPSGSASTVKGAAGAAYEGRVAVVTASSPARAAADRRAERIMAVLLTRRGSTARRDRRKAAFQKINNAETAVFHQWIKGTKLAFRSVVDAAGERLL